jgi:hypothetical protein
MIPLESRSEIIPGIDNNPIYIILRNHSPLSVHVYPLSNRE